jgi:CRP/FNR family transcriptional regulator, cyclic AMP receptor protein
MSACNGRVELRNCHSCPVRATGLFCNLPGEVLDDIAAAKHSFTYPQGTFLFFENESNRGIHILCSGQVKLSISSNAGRTLILHISTPGEVIGLASTLAGTPYEATAEVLQSSTVSFLRREDFLRLCKTHVELNAAVIRQLSSQYSSACEQLRTIGLSASAPQKMARLLLSWSRAGRETNEGIRVNVPLTHEQIAECLGSSRETVTRTLSDFKSRHLISLRGASMLIPNPAALEAVGGA